MATAFLLDSPYVRPFGTDAASAASLLAGARPTLRGRLHQLSALASVPAGAHLVARAAAEHRLAALAWAATWTAMFATSAGYHRLAHSAAARRRMRRADHSMIFVHMGGATTALSLLCLPALLRLLLLVTMWSGVGVGIGLKVTRLVEGRSAGSGLYAVLPATLLVALPAFAVTMTQGQLSLLVASGGLYAVGGVLFFQKRPDPLPRVFGYHEVWHCFTVAGGLCQYALLHQLVG